MNYIPVPAGEKGLADDNNDRTLGSYSDSVYIAQVNDSTVHVYNLYGAISEVNVFTLHNDYTMTLPVQPIDQSTEHSVFAFSADSKNFDIFGTCMPFSISWDKTLLVNYEDLLHCYKDNSLSFIDGSTFYVPGSAVRGDVNRDGNISIADVPTDIVERFEVFAADVPTKLYLYGNHGKWYPVRATTSSADCAAGEDAIEAGERFGHETADDA